MSEPWPLLSQRVLGTLSTVPKLAGRAIDQRWDAPEAGQVQAEFSAAGLAIDVDISEVDPAFSGHVSLRYKTAIPEAVLTTIPRRSLQFAVPANGSCARSAFLPRGRRSRWLIRRRACPLARRRDLVLQNHGYD
jgi:hypothetical protein